MGQSTFGLEHPNFDRLDAENAKFWPEHRIPHAKLSIYRQLERSTFGELSARVGAKQWSFVFFVLFFGFLVVLVVALVAFFLVVSVVACHHHYYQPESHQNHHQDHQKLRRSLLRLPPGGRTPPPRNFLEISKKFLGNSEKFLRIS